MKTALSYDAGFLAGIQTRVEEYSALQVTAKNWEREARRWRGFFWAVVAVVTVVIFVREVL